MSMAGELAIFSMRQDPVHKLGEVKECLDCSQTETLSCAAANDSPAGPIGSSDWPVAGNACSLSILQPLRPRFRDFALTVPRLTPQIVALVAGLVCSMSKVRSHVRKGRGFGRVFSLKLIQRWKMRPRIRFARKRRVCLEEKNTLTLTMSEKQCPLEVSRDMVLGQRQ